SRACFPVGCESEPRAGEGCRNSSFASVSAALAGTLAVMREAVVSGPATTPPVRGRARLAALTGRRRSAVPRDLHRLAGTGHVPLARPDCAVEAPGLVRLVHASQENQMEPVAAGVVDDAPPEHVVRPLRCKALFSVC